MKKTIVALTLMSIGFCSFAQNIETAEANQRRVSPVYTRDPSMPPSQEPIPGKSQRDTGAIFSLLGGAFIIAGIAVFADGARMDDIGFPVTQDETHLQGGVILFAAGLGMFIPGTVNWVKGARKMKGLPLQKQEVVPAKLAEVTTAAVSEITLDSAKSGGNITSDGGASVTARGVCWSVNPSPTIADRKTIDGPGGGAFVSLITGLTGKTSYFVRAYAITSNGVAYGISYSFTTRE